MKGVDAMTDFGTILKKLRSESGITQEALAKKLGVTKSVISYYELHERAPSPDILVKLTSVFNVSADYLLGIEKKASTSLDLSGLYDEDIQFIRQTVNLLKSKNSAASKK